MLDLRRNEVKKVKKDKKDKKIQGFTLVELSIVLVIIGLIVGGILVGQDMINAAKSRSTVAQIEKYNTAVNTFQEKYGELPGDYDLASTNLLATARNGNANGAIGENQASLGADPVTIAHTSGTNTNEFATFFHHLSLASLIDGNFDGTDANIIPGTNFPRPKTGNGGLMAYTGVDGQKYWYIGLAQPATVSPLLANGLSNSLRPDEAFSIDSKMDDGKPDRGIVQGRNNSFTTLALGDPDFADPGCVNIAVGVAPRDTNTAAADYKLNILSQQCSLRIRMN